MLEDDLFELVDSILKPLGSTIEEGEEFREPALDVLRYYVRPVKMGMLPVVGRGLSVVAVTRQPVDIGVANDGYRGLVSRQAKAVNGRFPPIRRGAGLWLGLSLVVVTPEPIGPEDDALLGRALDDLPTMRAVPLGLFRVNLGQEACSFALRRGPENLFPEPDALADAFAEKLRRFAPRMEI